MAWVRGLDVPRVVLAAHPEAGLVEGHVPAREAGLQRGELVRGVVGIVRRVRVDHDGLPHVVQRIRPARERDGQGAVLQTHLFFRGHTLGCSPKTGRYPLMYSRVTPRF